MISYVAIAPLAALALSSAVLAAPTALEARQDASGARVRPVYRYEIT